MSSKQAGYFKANFDSAFEQMIQDFKEMKRLGWKDMEWPIEPSDPVYKLAAAVAHYYDGYLEYKRGRFEDLNLELKLSSRQKSYLVEIERVIGSVKEFAASKPEMPEYLLLGSNHHRSSRTIKAYMEDLLESHFAENDRAFSGISLSIKRKLRSIINKPIFKFEPDQWLQNSEDISPITTSFKNKAKNIPSRIKPRIEELFQTYVHGHWNSAIALSRSILESALIDEHTRLKIEIYRVNEKGKKEYLSLNEITTNLTDTEQFREFDREANLIRTQGNDVMHDRKDLEGQVSRKRARDSIKALINILEAIYWDQP